MTHLLVLADQHPTALNQLPFDLIERLTPFSKVPDLRLFVSQFQDTTQGIAVLVNHQSCVILAENTNPSGPHTAVLGLPFCPPEENLRSRVRRGNKGGISPLRDCTTHDVPRDSEDVISPVGEYESPKGCRYLAHVTEPDVSGAYRCSASVLGHPKNLQPDNESTSEL